jgi:hypothetical protein
MAVHSVLLGQYHDLLALPVQQSLEAFRHYLLQAGEIPQLVSAKSIAALGQILARHVRVAAYADCFFLLSAVFISALLPAYLIRARRQRRIATPSSAPLASTDGAAMKVVR